MNLKESIELLLKTGKDAVQVLTIGGKEYSTQQLCNVPAPPADPIAEPVKLSTLEGLVNYIREKIEAENRQKYLVHVEHARQVSLISDPEDGYHKRRAKPAVAAADNLFTGKFQFNTFISHSEFMIGLQTLFEQDGDWETLAHAISDIKNEEVKQSQDNGLAQTVIAKSGIALVTEVEVPRIVTLRPFRTFREVDQPASQFVLRLQQKQNELPQVALFEADGGKWKLDAMNAVSKYLEDALIAWPKVVV